MPSQIRSLGGTPVKGRKKYGDELGIEQVAHIRALVEEQTAHIPQTAHFQVGDLVEQVTVLSTRPCTPHQIRHLRRVHLVHPEIDSSGDRKTYWYTRADLRDVLVIWALQYEHNIPLSKVGGLLWREECERNASLAQSSRGLSVSVTHNQMQRAQFHLRGRLLEVVSTWLFTGQVPRQAIILLRQIPSHRPEVKAATRVVAKDAEWSQVDRAFDRHPGDLVVSVSRDGEVLHHQEAVKWRDFRHYRWYHFLLQGDQPGADYHVIIGIPPDPGLPLSPVVSTPTAARVLTPLLRLCFLPQWKDRLGQASTPLQAVANMIPDISPFWQYCVILSPDRSSGESLIVLAHSTGFPRDVNTGTILSPGQFLSGWTYQTGQVCVVQQSIGRDDPRIARQSEERATAAIAVPTMVNGSINGVIYVGTRISPPDGEVFSGPQIGILRLLGNIVGEFIERQAISQQTRQAGLRILEEKPLGKKSWDELADHLSQALEEVKIAKERYDYFDNLHIMAVRVDNYHEIRVRSDQIVAWVAGLVAETVGDFYRAQYSVLPILYFRCPSEFVLVINHLRLDDAQERQLRRELRDRIGTLALPFDQGVSTIRVQCLVWSLSFRYSSLSAKLDRTGAQHLALALQHEVEDALANLPHINEAHDHEAMGAYQLAYDHYYLAHKRAPHNTYLMRHLAKVCTRLRDYHSAVGWWERVLNHERHPRFYQHLAEVYACLQDYSVALDHYRKAAELDPGDARCYLGWGQVLLAMDDYQAALDKFATARQLDRDNQALYALHEAEAYAGMGNYRHAADACERALIYDRDNPDAIKLLLQILPRCQQK